MSEHTPGQWPAVLRATLPEADDQSEQHLAYTAEQARFHLVLDSIRADLEAQPSQVCRHAAKRRWINAVAAIADELDQQLRNTG